MPKYWELHQILICCYYTVKNVVDFYDCLRLFSWKEQLAMATRPPWWQLTLEKKLLCWHVGWLLSCAWLHGNRANCSMRKNIYLGLLLVNQLAVSATLNECNTHARKWFITLLFIIIIITSLLVCVPFPGCLNCMQMFLCTLVGKK